MLGLTARGYRSKGLWQSNRSEMTEEEIYGRLSTKFEDIVDKLVVDVLHKDNDNYDKITIFPNGSTDSLNVDEKDRVKPELTRCDYYYSLQCFCINLSSRPKARAVQKLYVYMKKNAHVAVVAPGNYYGYERKRNEMYIEVGYSYRYQVLGDGEQSHLCAIKRHSSKGTMNDQLRGFVREEVYLSLHEATS